MAVWKVQLESLNNLRKTFAKYKDIEKDHKN